MRVWRLRASIVFSALLFVYLVYLVEVVYTRIPGPYPIASFEISLFTIFCLLFTSPITAYYHCLLYPCLFLSFFLLQYFNGGYWNLRSLTF